MFFLPFYMLKKKSRGLFSFIVAVTGIPNFEKFRGISVYFIILGFY